MKLIKPSFEILSTTGDVFKDIERVGRVCYKSEESIKEGTAKPFVEMLIKRGHTAMLEHGTIYLTYPNFWDKIAEDLRFKYNDYKYTICRLKSDRVGESTMIKGDYPYNLLSKEEKIDNDSIYITTNYRVLVENGWLDDLQYQCEPTEYHEKRFTVKFITDRGVSHEFVRHRVFSFAQESTRQMAA